MDPLVIRAGSKSIKTIASYFGLIETVDEDVKKLLHKDFLTAKLNLNYVRTAKEGNQLMYIEDALKNFLSASTVEENENLICCYVGMAVCQHCLGDADNARISLNKIENVKLKTKDVCKAITKGLCLDTIPGVCVLSVLTGPLPITRSFVEERKESFNKFKQLAMKTKLENMKLISNL